LENLWTNFILFNIFSNELTKIKKKKVIAKEISWWHPTRGKYGGQRLIRTL